MSVRIPKETPLIDENKSFENFVVGSFNEMAFKIGTELADKPGKRGKYPLLYIHGKSGLGKTHLLHAIAAKVQKNFPDMTIAFITAMDFMREMIHSIQLNTLSEFQEKYYSKIDFLIVDDVYEICGRIRSQKEFFHIINKLNEKGVQLIFTSNIRLEDIEWTDDRINTRIQEGLIIDIQKPDFENRVAILKKKASEKDIYLDEETYALIANHLTGNISELEGAMVRLCAHKSIMGVTLDIDSVKQILDIKSLKEMRELATENI